MWKKCVLCLSHHWILRALWPSDCDFYFCLPFFFLVNLFFFFLFLVGLCQQLLTLLTLNLLRTEQFGCAKGWIKLIPGLSDQALSVLNYDRTNHNIKPMEHHDGRMAKLGSLPATMLLVCTSAPCYNVIQLCDVITTLVNCKDGHEQCLFN